MSDLTKWESGEFAFHNPHGKPLGELPFIIGFNNGGSPGWYSGCLIAEDGQMMGGHVCSSEGFMYGDLGIIPGKREDRHAEFRAKYPDGYRMDFVSYQDAVAGHPALNAACAANKAKAAAATEGGDA